MIVKQLDLSSVPYFSSFFLDYIKGVASVDPFYKYSPSVESFKNVIADKQFSSSKRKVLHEVLLKQYKGIEVPAIIQAGIDSLRDENVFTVTTGHQLNIFTGPLYFIYKIISTINLAEALARAFPEKQFVPVYWMATEDHDFEEINHFHLFGKDYTWQTEQRGAVGRFDVTGIHTILEELPEKLSIFEEAYRAGRTLAQATRYFVNKLFGEYGLVILDGDDAELKSEFKEVLRKELVDNISFRKVEETIRLIEDLDYKIQVNPREINLFYMKESIRERIVLEDERYKILNTEISFSKEEILEEVDKFPERFSPNVILRPVYEEIVLPNVAYIGGPAEVIYWLELKPLFDELGVDFPILVPRNFVLFINKINAKKLKKLELKEQDLFLGSEELKSWVLSATDGEYQLDDEIEQINKVFQSIVEKTVGIDKSLEGYVLAERQKIVKQMEDISKRLKKADEKKNQEAINQVQTLKNKLFPSGGLQERKENFMNFYINDRAFISKLKEQLNPLDFNFNILIDEEEGA